MRILFGLWVATAEDYDVVFKQGSYFCGTIKRRYIRLSRMVFMVCSRGNVEERIRYIEDDLLSIIRLQADIFGIATCTFEELQLFISSFFPNATRSWSSHGASYTLAPE